MVLRQKTHSTTNAQFKSKDSDIDWHSFLQMHHHAQKVAGIYCPLFNVLSSVCSLSHRDGFIPHVWGVTGTQLFPTNHRVDWVFHNMWDGHFKSSDQWQPRLSAGQWNQTVPDPALWATASSSYQGMLKTYPLENSRKLEMNMKYE